MEGPSGIPCTWDGAQEQLQRLAVANRRAWIAWLDSLDPASSIRAFEDLCRTHPAVAADRTPKPEPVVLARTWRTE